MNVPIMTGVAILLGGLAARACYRLKQASDKLDRQKDVYHYLWGQFVETSEREGILSRENARLKEELEVYRHWGTPDVGQPIQLTQTVHYSVDDVKYTKDEIRQLLTTNVLQEVVPYVRWTSHTVGNTVFCEASLLAVDREVAKRGVHDVQGDHIQGNP